MAKSVKYEYDANKKQVVVLFKDGFTIENEETFCRSHYFNDPESRIITTMFKDQLLKLFNVDSVTDLKKKIDNNVKLHFKSGEGTLEYDEFTKTVIVYTESFKKDVVQPVEKTKRLKKSIEKLSNREEVSSHEYTSLLSTVADNISEVSLSEKDRSVIASILPKMIKNGEIKISLKDITDINKDRLKDVAQIGRDLLSKKVGIEKKLNLERKYIGSEFAWQRYFDLYGSYLLFGSIEEKKMEEWIQTNSSLRKTDSRLDILTINRYGFLDIVELKKSDEYLFKLDESHDNIVPTAKLSTAISQVNNYLMMLPYDTTKGELIRGAESATGLLVIGSKDYLMNKENIEKYAKKNKYSIETINSKIRKALRDLNYSYAHIQIVLYDDLLDNLENFINQMDVEIIN